MGLLQQSFGAGLEHGPSALFDLWLPASQLGKEIIHFLLHCGLGAEAQVGGHLLAHPVPDRFIRIEVWAVARQVHQAQAQSGQSRLILVRGKIPGSSSSGSLTSPENGQLQHKRREFQRVGGLSITFKPQTRANVISD